MCGIDQAIKYISECQPRTKGDDMPDRIVNRLRYIRAKDVGVKPKYRKGISGKKYDTWTCGNCGVTLRDGVRDNFCWNCGYRILWDSCRCLTGREDENEK